MTQGSGFMVVISGPSGAGKGTIVEKVMQRQKRRGRRELFLSVSATSRKPRRGERRGIHYHFHSREEFEELIRKDGLLEYTSYNGQYYGTPSLPVKEHLQAGNVVLLEIEVDGARQIKARCPEAIRCFVVPPNLKTLEQRLRKRATEDDKTIRSRLNIAKSEYRAAKKYDYIIVNDTIEHAVAQLEAIIYAERCRVNRRQQLLEGN